MISVRHVKEFCCEDISLIENYKQAINDETQIWHCHHRLETDEYKSKQQLIDEEKYYKRPAKELIFLTDYDHRSLHSSILQQKEETRKRQSEYKKNYWKNNPKPNRNTPEYRNARRNAILGRHKVWIDKEHNIYKYVK